MGRSCALPVGFLWEKELQWSLRPSISIFTSSALGVGFVKDSLEMQWVGRMLGFEMVFSTVMIATCDPEVLANPQHCDTVFKLPDHSPFLYWECLLAVVYQNPRFRGFSAFIYFLKSYSKRWYLFFCSTVFVFFLLLLFYFGLVFLHLCSIHTKN